MLYLIWTIEGLLLPNIIMNPSENLEIDHIQVINVATQNHSYLNLNLEKDSSTYSQNFFFLRKCIITIFQ